MRRAFPGDPQERFDVRPFGYEIKTFLAARDSDECPLSADRADKAAPVPHVHRAVLQPFVAGEFVQFDLVFSGHSYSEWCLKRESFLHLV